MPQTPIVPQSNQHQVVTMADLFASIRDKAGQLQWGVEVHDLDQLSEASRVLVYARAACLPQRRLPHQYCGTREEKGTSTTTVSILPKN